MKKIKIMDKEIIICGLGQVIKTERIKYESNLRTRKEQKTKDIYYPRTSVKW
jgi:hypothetical protein